MRIVLLLILLHAFTRGNIQTTNLNSTSAQELINLLVKGGVEIKNARYRGVNSAGGSFRQGGDTGMEIDEGIILSSGRIDKVAGPNNSDFTGTLLGAGGDNELESLVHGGTYDAAVLEFDFKPVGNQISFNYVFGSDEYPEYVGSEFNDVFAFFLNGQNIALIPGSNKAVSINNINNKSYSSYYHDNDINSGGPGYNIECDGFTVVLEAKGEVVPNQFNHIKLAIADVADEDYDSWVFIEAGSFVSGADLELTSMTDSCFRLNKELNIQLTVKNLGPSNAENVVITETLDPNLELISVNGNYENYSLQNGILTINMGPIAANTEEIIFLTVLTNNSNIHEISHSGYVESSTEDPVPENNNISEQISRCEDDLIIFADLEIQKTADSCFKFMEPFNYYITITNHGDSTADSVYMADQISNSLELVNCTGDQQWYDFSSSLLTCFFDSISPGKTVSTQVAAIATDTSYHTFINTVEVFSSFITDTIPGNDSASVSIELCQGDYRLVPEPETIYTYPGADSLFLIHLDYISEFFSEEIDLSFKIDDTSDFSAFNLDKGKVSANSPEDRFLFTVSPDAEIGDTVIITISGVSNQTLTKRSLACFVIIQEVDYELHINPDTIKTYRLIQDSVTIHLIGGQYFSEDVEISVGEYDADALSEINLTPQLLSQTAPQGNLRLTPTLSANIGAVYPLDINGVSNRSSTEKTAKAYVKILDDRFTLHADPETLDVFRRVPDSSMVYMLMTDNPPGNIVLNLKVADSAMFDSFFLDQNFFNYSEKKTDLHITAGLEAGIGKVYEFMVTGEAELTNSRDSVSIYARIIDDEFKIQAVPDTIEALIESLYVTHVELIADTTFKWKVNLATFLMDSSKFIQSSLNPDSLSINSAQSSYSFSLNKNALPGEWLQTRFHGVSQINSKSESAYLHIHVVSSDYQLINIPDTIFIYQGVTDSFAIAINSDKRFNEPVFLSWSTLYEPVFDSLFLVSNIIDSVGDTCHLKFTPNKDAMIDSVYSIRISGASEYTRKKREKELYVKILDDHYYLFPEPDTLDVMIWNNEIAEVNLAAMPEFSQNVSFSLVPDTSHRYQSLYQEKHLLNISEVSSEIRFTLNRKAFPGDIYPLFIHGISDISEFTSDTVMFLNVVSPPYSIEPQPDEFTLYQGGADSSKLLLHWINGFVEDVTISLDDSASQYFQSATLDDSILTPDGPETKFRFKLAWDKPLPKEFSISFHSLSNYTALKDTARIRFIILEDDYSLYCEPNRIKTKIGYEQSLHVVMKGEENFSQTVKINLLPDSIPGFREIFIANPILSLQNNKSEIVFSTNPIVQIDSLYEFQINGVSELTKKQRETAFQVEIIPPEYEIIAVPDTFVIYPLEKDSFYIFLKTKEIFIENITLTIKDSSDFTFFSFSSGKVNIEDSSDQVHFTLGNVTGTGSFPLSVYGQGDSTGTVCSTEVVFLIKNDAFQLIPEPNLHYIEPNVDYTSKIILDSIHDFTQDVDISLSNTDFSDNLNYAVLNKNILTANDSVALLEFSFIEGIQEGDEFQFQIIGLGNPSGYLDTAIVRAIVLEPEVEIAPETFTPNDDGYNDFVIVRTKNGASVAELNLVVFNMMGREVISIRQKNTFQIKWNGKDKNGQPQPFGAYLYYVKVNGKISFKGVITIVR